MAELEFNQTNPQEAAAAGQNQTAETAAPVQQQAQMTARQEANPAQDQGLAQQSQATLSFGSPAAPQVAVAADPAEAKMDDSILTPQERAQAEAFAEKIDLTDSNGILSYGAGTQQRMASFSEQTLNSVRNKDMGEVGDMITNLIGELKNFDASEQEKGLFGIFHKAQNRIETLRTRYSKVETNVGTITRELEKHQQTLLKDIAMLDQMYVMNLDYYKELTMYIIAGKKRLADVRNGQLKELEAKAAQTGSAEDAQAAKDLAAQCDRFEKKLYDLELTRTISVQTGPQIRMVQSSDTMMAEKIQTTIVNTIPLWKNQMVIALGVEHATQAAKAQREVTDMTNELLRKNADKLKSATIEAAKESERGIVDIETLQHTNNQLISTLDEVMQIQKDGKAKRADAEKQLVGIENQLKEKLLQAAQN